MGKLKVILDVHGSEYDSWSDATIYVFCKEGSTSIYSTDLEDGSEHFARKALEYGIVLPETDDYWDWDDVEIEIPEEKAVELYRANSKPTRKTQTGPSYSIPTYREEWVDEKGIRHFKQHLLNINPD